MPYFPYPKAPSPYFCPRCKAWYVQAGEYAVSCTVVHSAGDCCHYGEIRIEQPEGIKR